MHIIVGLRNKGIEYLKTRHNAGGIVVAEIVNSKKLEPKMDKIFSGNVFSGEIKDEKVKFVLPELFMNNSGVSLKNQSFTPKKLEKLVIVHDDIDLPLGKFKISFGRNSGGHKGVESVIRACKSKDFVRVRIGICPVTPSGKLKKMESEKIPDFVVGDFKSPEFEIIKKISKEVLSALEVLIEEGRPKAMTLFN